MSRGDRLREQLFLLEFVLQKLCIPECLLKKQPRLRLKFADFSCIELQSEGRGKRCLFSMPALELACRLDTRPLAVSLVAGDAKLPMAAGRVPLQALSDAARRASSAKSSLPDACAFQQEVVLKPTGRLRLLVRLSCLGPAVVTQFQLSGQPDRALFRGCEPDWRSVCPDTGAGAPKLTRLPLRALLCTGVREEPRLAPLKPMEPTAVAAKCECQELLEAPPPKDSRAYVGPSVPRIPLVQTSAPRLMHPHVRCDTTGKLSPAYLGAAAPGFVGTLASKLHPRVRYDTTGRLSPYFQGLPGPPLPNRLRVRYDTTGKLSPAYQRPLPSPTILKLPPLVFEKVPAPTQKQHPKVRYDTTGRLSPWCMDRVAIRCDTTSCMSPAFQTATTSPPEYVPPTPLREEESENEEEEEEVAEAVATPWPPVRYDTTGLLSPAYVAPEESDDEGGEQVLMQAEEPAVREQTKFAQADQLVNEAGDAGRFQQRDTRTSPSTMTGDQKPKKRSRPRRTSPSQQTEQAPTSPMPSQRPESGDSDWVDPLQTEPADTEAAVELLKRLSHQRKVSRRGKRRKRREKEPKARGISAKHLRELTYPIEQTVHTVCIDARPHVPHRMGWLWNLNDLGDNLRARPNWKPGAVTRSVSRILRLHSATPQQAHSTATRTHRRGQMGAPADLGPLGPTLVLGRRGRQYTVAVKPARAGHGETVNEPLQFTVPRPSSSSSSRYTLETSSSSGLEVEFLAPCNFPPPRGPPQLRTREVQCYGPNPSLRKSSDNKGKKKKGEKKAAAL
ncbi:uncharacterized protein LOC126338779 [Schistocerca gregaria]|uniref:uncharacterized protein LOC126338779 n=1 Tax=Schistocerca gregaria TaxID=7010 RepID=UPI00211E6A14|nr:uncharacterized protein LOC126338779 [Schistocerca gregaria]XP_049857540.1 uncharacterized protein LOC126338779 [Schistocerca gregaria]